MWSMPRLYSPSYPLERIGFMGPMAAGKTYLADYLVKNHGYTKYSFASMLKSVCYTLYGIDKKDGESRKILQRVGQQMREHDPEVWVKATMKQIQDDMLRWNTLQMPIVIDDVRYQNEVTALVNNGFSIIRLTTDEIVRRERVARLYPDTDFDTASKHGSETEWKHLHYDASMPSENLQDILALAEWVENAKDSPDWKAPTGERTSSATSGAQAQIQAGAS